MSSWNNPNNIAPNSILSSSLWNNLLGTNTSLQYAYDNNVFFSKRFLSISASSSTSSSLIPTWLYGSETSINWFSSGYPMPQSIVLPEPGVYMMDFYCEFSVGTVDLEFQVNSVVGYPLLNATELGVSVYKHYNFIFSTDSQDLPNSWDGTMLFAAYTFPPTSGTFSNISLTIAKINGTI